MRKFTFYVIRCSKKCIKCIKCNDKTQGNNQVHVSDLILKLYSMDIHVFIGVISL